MAIDVFFRATVSCPMIAVGENDTFDWWGEVGLDKVTSWHFSQSMHGPRRQLNSTSSAIAAVHLLVKSTRVTISALCTEYLLHRSA